MKKARPEGNLRVFSCGKKLNTLSKKLLTSNNLNKESKMPEMYKPVYFVHCEECLTEYNTKDVTLSSVTHSPFGIKIAEFVCTECEKPVQSLITEV